MIFVYAVAYLHTNVSSHPGLQVSRPHIARFEHKNQVNLTFGFPELQLLAECKRMIAHVQGSFGEARGRDVELTIMIIVGPGVK